MEYIDIHSHILPGVDDGSQSMEQSLVMLRQAVSNGIGKVILTPHNKAERRNVSVDGIRKRTDALQKAAMEDGIPVTLYTGMEISYRHGVVDLLEEGKLCTLAGSQYVLVEFHPMEQFNYIKSAVYEFVSCGYIPVLAHVERYECMASKLQNVSDVIDRGALIQVNASTVTGRMGYKGKQNVKKLLKERLVHFIATDAHDEENRGVYLNDCKKYLCKKFGEEYTAQLLYDNASRIIQESV